MKSNEIRREKSAERLYQCYDLQKQKMLSIKGYSIRYHIPSGSPETETAISEEIDITIVDDGNIKWVGLEPDYFLLIDERVVGIKFLDGSLLWSHSRPLIVKSEEKTTEMTDIPKAFEDTIAKERPFTLLYGKHDGDRGIYYTILRDTYRRLGLVSESSYQLHLIKAVDWVFAEDTLRLRVARADLNLTFEISVNLETRKITGTRKIER